MSLVDSVIVGLANGFGAAVGAYLAGVWAIKHLENAREKGGWKKIKEYIKREVEGWE